MGAGLALNPDTMSTSIFRLTELPIEILEQILLHLPRQDIIKMEVVRCVVTVPDDLALTLLCMVQISRQFQALTRDSPTLQYQRDLFSAGLTENPCNSCDFSQRRKLSKERGHKWSSAGRVTGRCGHHRVTYLISQAPTYHRPPPSLHTGTRKEHN